MRSLGLSHAYAVGWLMGLEILKQPLQTSVSFDTADFDTFGAEDGVHVAVSLKDFKAIVVHADSLHASVTAYYSDAGRPLQVTYEQEGMNCEFTLMTLGDNRAFTTTRVEHQPPAPPPPPKAVPPPSQTDTPSQQQGMMSAPGSLRSQFAGSFRSQRTTEDRVIQPAEEHQSSGSLYRSRLNISGTTSSRSGSAFTQQQEPELPPVPASAVAPEGLFLPYSSSDEESDDDDLGKVAWDEPFLKWDTNLNSDDRPRPVVRDQSPPPPPPRVPPPVVSRKRALEPSGDTTQSEEEEEEEEMNAKTVMEAVGPTQDVSQARGLFDD